jgi:hypothetical protein
MKTHNRTVRFLVAAALAILAAPGIAPAQDALFVEGGWREDAKVEPAQTLVQRFAISIDDLWYCYGYDEDDEQCSLHLGTRESCESLMPCAVPASEEVKAERTAQILKFPPSSDLHFCKGFNEDTNRCETYLGSRAACESLPPCL